MKSGVRISTEYFLSCAMYNKDFLDALSIVSFMVGIANYDENLSQSDKDDLMKSLDEKTNGMIARLEVRIEEQNAMLREILEKLERIK